MLAVAGRNTGLAWCALLLLGCTAALPPSAAYPHPEQQTAIQATIQSWQVADLPWAHTCDAEVSRIRVVVSAPTEFTSLCGRRPAQAGGKLYACNTEQYEKTFPLFLFDSQRVPLLVISRLQPQEHRRRLVVHETLHWLERCSGKGIDFDHADTRVWEDVRMMAHRLLDGKGSYRLAQEQGMPVHLAHR